MNETAFASPMRDRMYLAYAILVLLSIAIWVAIRWYRLRERGIDQIKSRVRQAAKLKWSKRPRL